MYNNYFGLSESPFSIAPNPRYLFLSEQYQEALAHLLYGIGSNGGFVLLTGEVGTGKTTVCRRLLEQMPENTDVAMILNPKASVEELLAALCDELGIVYPPGDQVRSKTYIDLINRHLLDTHAQGRSTVLIIDEAQNLGVVLLEQIRLLTNLETNECKLLQIVLVGQPELLELLARPELRQLSQRITARFHLGALSLKDLEAYIVHRLAVAGLNRPIFPAPTLKRLYRLSGGIPRVVNILCDRALLGSFVQRDNRVEVATLVKASREVFGDETALQLSSKDSWRWLLALAVTAVLAAWLVGFAVAAWVADGARVPGFEPPFLERWPAGARRGPSSSGGCCPGRVYCARPRLPSGNPTLWSARCVARDGGRFRAHSATAVGNRCSATSPAGSARTGARRSGGSGAPCGWTTRPGPPSTGSSTTAGGGSRTPWPRRCASWSH
jgi:general secretion pathway protein A